MSFNMSFICDKSCPKAVQPVLFDHLNETWGDVIEEMRSLGWGIKTDENHQIISSICPDCKNEIDG